MKNRSMRFESAPTAQTELLDTGALAFTRLRTALVFRSDGRVSYLTELLDPANGVAATREQTGRVVAASEDGRLELEVRGDDRDAGLRITARRVDDELVCHVASRADGTATSALLMLVSDPIPVVVGPSQTPRPRATPPPLPREVTPQAAYHAAIELQVGEASDAECEAAYTKLNRQLQAHGGAANSLRMRELPDAERLFLRELLSGPLEALRHLARSTLRELPARGDRPTITDVVALERPAVRGGPWRIQVGDSAPDGALVEFKMIGWAVLDQRAR